MAEIVKVCPICGKEFKPSCKRIRFCSPSCASKANYERKKEKLLKNAGAKAIDLTGQKFGRLTVLKRAGYHTSPKGQKSITWLCKCDCGNEIIVIGNTLKNNSRNKSCGCIAKEQEIFRKIRKSLYTVYQNIKARTKNKNHKHYRDYGGRGITICPEWDSNFNSFYNWSINNKYKKGLTIDRIDNNGNYEPSNCRWVDVKTQCNNRRSNHNITFNGETHTLSEWTKITGLTRRALEHRIKRGWDIEKALFTPQKNKEKQ